MPKKSKHHFEHYRLSKADDAEGSGYVSAYEDEEGNRYHPLGEAGKSKCTTARFLLNEKGDSTKIVLSPILNKGDEITPDDRKEATNKFNFFNAIYPHHRPFLFFSEGTYRLVLPKVPGCSYNNAPKVATYETQLKHAIGLIEAIEKAHENGFVILDFKEDNVFYSESLGKFYLIDGGSYQMIGTRLTPTFMTIDEPGRAAKKDAHPQIAPECWYLVNEVEGYADYVMDVYSLGVVMRNRFEEPPDAIANLISACLQEDPKFRPGLTVLKNQFLTLLKNYLNTDADNESTTDSVIEHLGLNHSASADDLDDDEQGSRFLYGLCC